MQLGVFFTFVLFAHFICLTLKKGKIKYKEKCCDRKKGKGSSRLSPLGILFQCTKSCSHPTIQARFSWMVVKPLISTMADTLLPSCECSLSCRVKCTGTLPWVLLGSELSGIALCNVNLD